MEFVLNLLTGYALSAIISYIIYVSNKEYIISRGNENEILSFYEKDIKSYKNLEYFFRQRKTVQKPLNFSLIGGIIGTYSYFVGMLVITAYIMYVKKETAQDGPFNLLGYLIGYAITQNSRRNKFIKAKESIDHYEKIQQNKIK